ncbi:MAG: histidine--tRNA ligase [Desulfatiglandaceae bacterium]
MEFTAIKGFKDVLPDEIGLWQLIETRAKALLDSFCFQEIRPPLIEKNEVFSRGIGQETDIVSKEMYCITDSKGAVITLRPEATASMVRAYIQHRLYLQRPVQKLYTIGPMFRHERPQKGRYRQFHQVDVEIFGDSGPRSDCEVIAVAYYLLQALGLNGLSLKLNSLGCRKCRPRFKKDLREYLSDRADGLCADCRRRAVANPLRVFDCKVEGCGKVVADAPAITDYLCGECSEHFDGVQELLSALDIKFFLDPSLVRGLDYYARTTFEIQTDRLGAQNAVVGGGRYDGLVELLGGPDHPAIGFAMGMERLVALLEENGPLEQPGPDLFVASLGAEAEKICFRLIQKLRTAGVRVEAEYQSRSLKAQMKRAGKVDASYVLIVGENELRAGKGVLKNMSDGSHVDIPLSDAESMLAVAVGKK